MRPGLQARSRGRLVKPDAPSFRAVALDLREGPQARCPFFPGHSANSVGGPSGPPLLFQAAAIGHKSIGPEDPPTRSGRCRQPLSRAARARRSPPRYRG
ncbi:DUF6053 domain-containing protein [Lysobacter enzymogenes]|uniref:DUF6053 domain-containing protein n=1 Tax=Lysobacter enzymogenes TaxID=69 RepID=UPI003D2F802D